MKRFNLRVYGILVNERKEILLSSEQYRGLSFVKFPGGGVSVGESLPDALKREFMEECDLKVTVDELLHLTDILVPSAFDDSQIIGAYYRVRTTLPISETFRNENVDLETNSVQSFYWAPLIDFSNQELYFEMDKLAWQDITLNEKLKFS